MAGFFYNLGRSVRAGVQKGKWVFQSLTGSEKDSIKAEYEAGIEIAREFEKETKIDRDETVTQVISDISAALAARVKNKHRRFSVKVVLVEEPNAFALPGGFIYITRPLIELCAAASARIEPAPMEDHLPARRDSASDAPPVSLRDELAFILGHEMGHVVRGHAMQRMVNATLVNTASKAVPIGGPLGRIAVQAGSKFLSAAYSQDHEFEADAFGLRLARAAGFDEHAAIAMMKRLQQLGGDHPEDSLGSYFASHPPFTARIRAMKKKMRT